MSSRPDTSTAPIIAEPSDATASETPMPLSGAIPPDAGPASTSKDWRHREVGMAVRNALTLGLSLTATWGIALVVRLYVPRLLGPERFGVLNFADAFTATAFVALNLGVETYVRKEISVRPEHANDFIGGIIALRLALTVLVFGGMELVLRWTGRTEEMRMLSYIYGVGQFFVNGSATSSGLLHARGEVKGMSIVTVGTKLLWGAGVAAAIFLKLGLWAFALSYVVSEGVKSGLLFAFARKSLKLDMRVDTKATWAVIVASAPFLISTVATTVYNRLDVTILSVKATDQEVGWYGASTSLAGLTLLLTPLISWVLMPLFARAAEVSEEELCSLVRRSLELILVLAIPLALAMALGAPLWISIAFGSKFAPAALALRLQAGVFVLMYVSIITWCALTMLNRAWGMTVIFVGGLVVNPTLNLLLIGPGLAHYGPGGGGAACALATFGTEVGVVGPMLVMLGRRAVDARLLRVTATCLAVCAVIVALDHVLSAHMGYVRLIPEGLLYVVLVLVFRAITIEDLAGWVRIAKRRVEQRKSA
jgi:O-antigen/teichoic acid export membrane protein